MTPKKKFILFTKLNTSKFLLAFSGKHSTGRSFCYKGRVRIRSPGRYAFRRKDVSEYSLYCRTFLLLGDD